MTRREWNSFQVRRPAKRRIRCRSTAVVVPWKSPNSVKISQIVVESRRTFSLSTCHSATAMNRSLSIWHASRSHYVHITPMPSSAVDGSCQWFSIIQENQAPRSFHARRHHHEASYVDLCRFMKQSPTCLPSSSHSSGLMFSLSYLFMVQALAWMFIFLGWNRVRNVSCMQCVWVGAHFLHLIYCSSYRDHEMPRRNLLAWRFIDNRHLMSLLAFHIPSSQLHPRYSHE